MTSPKQHTANQANALRSTGPRTQAGKARAAQNAARHGLRGQFYLITGEAPEQYDTFRDHLHRHLRPAGALEEALAERVIEAFWRLRRIGRIEAEMMDCFMEEAQRREQYTYMRDGIQVVSSGPPPVHPFGINFGPSVPLPSPPPRPKSEVPKVSLGKAVREQMQNSDVIGKFHRYEAHIERGLYRALHELQRLQAARRGQAVPAPVAVDILNQGGTNN